MARPKGATNIASRAVKDIIDSCVDMKDVISKLVELTNGVQVKKITEDGVKIYDEKPDSYAAKILLEYRYGKPAQSVDLTTGGEPINRPVYKLPDGTIVPL